MAGRFTNNNQVIMLNTLVDTAKELVNNGFYEYSDKKGTVVDYWNTSNKTTLDNATEGQFSYLGDNSPIRFNLIRDFILYGITKMDIDLEMGDNGMEASDITGEAIVVPNTIIPYTGDYFTVKNINKEYLFKVTSVNVNTIDMGATEYKISYILSNVTHASIDNQVVETFNFLFNSVGTELNPVIKSSTYDFLSKLEDVSVKLKDYFNMIFYNKEIQSYNYLYKGSIRVYDPYLIEFIIRNKILKGSTNYTHVAQQMYLNSTFGVYYDKSIFGALERQSIKVPPLITGNIFLIDQKLSLLYAYPENYYCMEFANINPVLPLVNVLDDNIINDITNNTMTDNHIYNIIVSYFNSQSIIESDIDALEIVNYLENQEMYYLLPILIFCIERTIIRYLKK